MLALQGFVALLLPRRFFLRLSSLLQLTAFAYFLASYFLEPGIFLPKITLAAAQQGALNPWPSYWFFAMLQQLSGRMPAQLHPLAVRGWIALAIALTAAAASLLLVYLRTMKKTVEEPDLVPGARGFHWSPRFGKPLTTAVVLFTVRSLARSRQHRVVYAFYLAVAFAIAVSTLRDVLIGGSQPLTPGFLMGTMVMMSLAIVGLRSVFSLPVSLRANWVLQITQLRPSVEYLAATRTALLLLSALPVWITAALLSLCFRPRLQAAEHLLVLAFIASNLADLSLIGVSKIPFACSWLPGKSNIQYMFWGFLAVFIPIAMEFANYELRALAHPRSFALMIAILAVPATALWIFNRRRARSSVLYYEEQPPEIITTLGLSAIRLSDMEQPFSAISGNRSLESS